jgi:hypothetical protein
MCGGQDISIPSGVTTISIDSCRDCVKADDSWKFISGSARNAPPARSIAQWRLNLARPLGMSLQSWPIPSFEGIAFDSDPFSQRKTSPSKLGGHRKSAPDSANTDSAQLRTAPTSVGWTRWRPFRGRFGRLPVKVLRPR